VSPQRTRVLLTFGTTGCFTPSCQAWPGGSSVWRYPPRSFMAAAADADRGSTDIAQALVPAAAVQLRDRVGHFAWLHRLGVVLAALGSLVNDCNYATYR
jgi:hypothetical protein